MVFRLFAFFVKRSAKTTMASTEKNLDRYRTSNTCILTSDFCCFTCESISIVFELFTPRKYRVLGCTSNAVDLL